MERDELEVLELMRSVQRKYFPSCTRVSFCLYRDASVTGVAARVKYGAYPEIDLYYNDLRVLEPDYRMGLVPVVAHELAHLIDPVDPDRILAERLPTAMVALWKELKEAGEAVCSMDAGA